MFQIAATPSLECRSALDAHHLAIFYFSWELHLIVLIVALLLSDRHKLHVVVVKLLAQGAHERLVVGEAEALVVLLSLDAGAQEACLATETFIFLQHLVAIGYLAGL